MIRTRELLHHKQYLSARRAWNQTTRKFNKTEWILAAHLCKKWQWHNGAITSMIRAEYWDNIELRFPVSFEGEFQEHSRLNGIPKHWLISLARQETRNYVQNVLAFSAIYAKKLGIHEQMISEQEKMQRL